ncbi:acyltransferase family protein [Arthrobacter zhaoxinii]|uniref:acyltransferase family protein n=1 Tax=Arthrobacter zhaoxinii TaxID=2964616 RepID=UPI0021033F3F|nr:acyltransferase [Arthrobacter zhaoxinii]MCQ2001780.1 acyltransferase [Arthrobacter zhaoxinii]
MSNDEMPRTEMRKRIDWMDSLRGLAIVFVLIWHAVSIPTVHGYSLPTWIESINNSVLPFRMPLLMFLSGTLLARSFGKSTKSYYLGKFQRLVWPYLVWSLIYILQYPDSGSLWDPRAWIATGHLWFIFFITFYYLVAPAFRNLPVLVIPALSLLVALVLPGGVVQMLFYFAVFFFMGNAVTRHPNIFNRMLKSRLAIGVSAMVALLLGFMSATYGTEHNAWFAPANLAGILAIIAGAQKVENAACQTILRYIGKHSIYFYFSHFAAMTVALVALEALGTTAYGVRIPVLLAVGSITGFVLSGFRDRPPVRWAFSPPRMAAGFNRVR